MTKHENRHESSADHELWVQCFLAAISGATSGQPEDVAALSARVADAALEEERRRRRPEEPPWDGRPIVVG